MASSLTSLTSFIAPPPRDPSMTPSCLSVRPSHPRGREEPPAWRRQVSDWLLVTWTGRRGLQEVNQSEFKIVSFGSEFDSNLDYGH